MPIRNNPSASDQWFDPRAHTADSPEAKDYDFSVGDTFFVGDVEFRTRYFYCPKCQLDISFFIIAITSHNYCPFFTLNIKLINPYIFIFINL